MHSRVGEGGRIKNFVGGGKSGSVYIQGFKASSKRI